MKAYLRGTAAAAALLVGATTADAGQLYLSVFGGAHIGNDLEPVTGGGGLGTWDTTVNTAVPAQSTPGVYVLPITVSQVYTRGDAVMVSISRAPAHANDTSTAAFSMYGIDTVYADTGPNGGGANVFAVSARRLP